MLAPVLHREVEFVKLQAALVHRFRGNCSSTDEGFTLQ